MTIDQCYENIIAQLTAQGRIKEVSRKLLSIDNNGERVLYVYEIFDNLKAFPNIELVIKSEYVSTHYRNLGNKYFKTHENFEAWQYYNLSILNAPIASSSHVLALANRSAVLFEFEKYEECLKDIESVLTLNPPDNIFKKLNKRKEKCTELMLNNISIKEAGTNTELADLLLVKGARDIRYPSASKKLQVVCDQDTMGRHVIAKEDIKVGEVLVDEDPYFILVLKQQILFCCNYCLNRSLNLLPCDRCCFAFYCSVECKLSAWKDYHAIECPLMASLIEMNFTKLELLALRTVIKARTGHPTWDSLFKEIKEAEANVHTEFHGHVKVNDEWVYKSKYYSSIHTLESNIEKRSISDIFQKSSTAAVFLKYLASGTDFLKSRYFEESKAIKKCVAGMLLLHTMTSATNMHGISANIQNNEGDYVEEMSIASAPYAFHSLLNHSCAPNVVRFSELNTGRMKLFALRPIKKGQQLFDNYGPHHALQERKGRQDSLKFQYKFICVCEACENDWPMYLSMACSKKIPIKIIRKKDSVLTSDAIDSLQKGKVDTAVKIYGRLCRLCEDLEPYAPCKELSECQESLKQCLVIFQGLVPLGHCETVEWSIRLQC